jgi:hypothetical protein
MCQFLDCGIFISTEVLSVENHKWIYQGEKLQQKLALKGFIWRKSLIYPCYYESPNKFFFDFREIERLAIDDVTVTKGMLFFK